MKSPLSTQPGQLSDLVLTTCKSGGGEKLARPQGAGPFPPPRKVTPDGLPSGGGGGGRVGALEKRSGLTRHQTGTLST